VIFDLGLQHRNNGCYHFTTVTYGTIDLEPNSQNFLNIS